MPLAHPAPRWLTECQHYHSDRTLEAEPVESVTSPCRPASMSISRSMPQQLMPCRGLLTRLAGADNVEAHRIWQNGGSHWHGSYGHRGGRHWRGRKLAGVWLT